MTAVVQVNTQQLRITIDAMHQFEDVFTRHQENTYQGMQAIIEDIFEGNIQALCHDLLINFHPQFIETATIIEDLIRRLRQFLERLEEADRYSDNLAELPPPRVYLINGINATSPDGIPNPSMAEFEQFLEAHTTIPGSDIVATPAIYNTDLRDLLHGSLWPMDPGKRFLLDKILGFANTPYGAGEVSQELLLGSSGNYTRETADFIAQDLIRNPLKPGQKILLIGHSGGGIVASNLAGTLEQRFGVDVEGSVTMGSPVFDDSRATLYVEKTLHINDHHDPLVMDQYRHQHPLLADMLDQTINPVRFWDPTSVGASHSETVYAETYSNTSPGGGHSSYMQNKEVVDILGAEYEDFGAYVK